MDEHYDEPEFWKTAEDFTAWQISSWGNIRNVKTGEGARVWFNREANEKWAAFREDYISFRGPVWYLMCWAFYDFWSIGVVTPDYRDGDPNNLDYFNLLWNDTETGEPVMCRWNEGTRMWSRVRHLGRKVRVIETGEVFSNVRECSEVMKLSSNSVYMVLRGAAKSHHGVSFEWAN